MLRADQALKVDWRLVVLKHKDYFWGTLNL
jgi:hypothetical protein